MQFNYTSLAIRLLFLNGVILSLSMMQYVMDINLIPPNLEGWAAAIVVIFQICVFLIYAIALLTEISEMKESFLVIKEDLRKLNDSHISSVKSKSSIRKSQVTNGGPGPPKKKLKPSVRKPRASNNANKSPSEKPKPQNEKDATVSKSKNNEVKK